MIEMKILKYIAIVLTVIIIIVALYLPFLGRRDAKFYDSQRIRTLNEIRNIYSKNPGDLYEVCCKSNQSLTLPYTDGRGAILLNLFQVNKILFYKYFRYKVIKSDGWWVISELEYGIKGKYFFIITQNGAIAKVEGAFLPEQENANYPPAFYENRIDTWQIERELRSSRQQTGN